MLKQHLMLMLVSLARSSIPGGKPVDLKPMSHKNTIVHFTSNQIQKRNQSARRKPLTIDPATYCFNRQANYSLLPFLQGVKVCHIGICYEHKNMLHGIS
jgi:hypothetical protein